MIVGPMELSDKELTALMGALDDGSVIGEDQLAAFVEWAEQTKFRRALWAMIMEGSVRVRWPDGAKSFDEALISRRDHQRNPNPTTP